MKPNFVAIDGECFEGSYDLLASNDAHIYNPTGLTTKECLDFLWKLGRSYWKLKPPGVPRRGWEGAPVFICFGLHFDVNHFFKELEVGELELLYAGDWIPFDPYQVKYIHKKKLIIRRGRKSVTIFDVWGFFQSPFVAAVRKFLNKETFPLITQHLKKLVEGKKARGTFKRKDFMKVFQYNKLECRLLCDLMHRINEMLLENGITLKQWYGASAIAGWLLRDEVIHYLFPRYSKKNTSDTLRDVWDRAYYGGRIEAVKLGGFAGPLYAYDINSAYAAAIQLLPALTSKWWFTFKYLPEEPFSVWFLEWDLPDSAHIGPFPWRSRTGRVYFPKRGAGWYWAPEVAEALKRYRRYIHIREGWGHEYPGACRLYPFINDLYDRRQALKTANNPSEYILKLGLANLYGKFAQRIGKPQYQCFPYAGWVTSFTRSMLLEASWKHEKSIIGYATDSILSTAPLDVPLSNQLGHWRMKEYHGGIYLMPGVYYLEGEGEPKVGMRGFRIEPEDWLSICHQLNANARHRDPAHRAAVIEVPLFMTYKLSKATDDWENSYRFISMRRIINPYGLDKRVYRYTAIHDWLRSHCNSTLFTPYRIEQSHPVTEKPPDIVRLIGEESV